MLQANALLLVTIELHLSPHSHEHLFSRSSAWFAQPGSCTWKGPAQPSSLALERVPDTCCCRSQNCQQDLKSISIRKGLALLKLNMSVLVACTTLSESKTWRQMFSPARFKTSPPFTFAKPLGILVVAHTKNSWEAKSNTLLGYKLSWRQLGRAFFFSIFSLTHIEVLPWLQNSGRWQEVKSLRQVVTHFYEQDKGPSSQGFPNRRNGWQIS